ncbi:DUF6223 family protein [Nocardia farcinica]|uniref:DUF6223 family protein n=1 Tax=Nocardia farcinica TaxID=37329 RepID=UPI0024589453|nr:DUF6223 family protein [Nocardia farcinica]
MDLPHLLTAAQSTLVRSAVGSRVLAERAAAPLAAVTDLSTGRIAASSAALIGLAGVLAGILALTRPHRFGAGRTAIAALAAGLAGLAIGGVVVATARGAVGSGNGLGGAYVAVLVGAVAAALGAVALVRARRAE